MKNREPLFHCSRQNGGDPYYHYLYSLDLAGGEPQLLTPSLLTIKSTGQNLLSISSIRFRLRPLRRFLSFGTGPVL